MDVLLKAKKRTRVILPGYTEKEGKKAENFLTQKNNLPP